MVNVYIHGPHWFFGMDAILEAGAALIALCVTFASLKIYLMTGEKKYGYFTSSFGLLTLSFLSRAITDALLEDVFFKLPSEIAAKVFFTGYVAHIMLALTAYTLLLIITHKITDKRIIALLFLIMVPSLLLSGSYFLSFYGLSAIFLAFIALAYYHNYKKVSKATACLVFISFTLLTIAQTLFLLEAAYQTLFVPAHITQAAGYLVILFALIKAMLK